MRSEALVVRAERLQNGQGDRPPDLEEAKELYQRAINELADVEAMFLLARLLEDENPDNPEVMQRVVELYGRAINEGGHVKAAYELARILHDGAPGIDKDHPRAVQFYQRAIDGGSVVNAMFNLGVLLRKGGYGVPPDEVRAAELYQRAIDADGHVGAKFNLADMLYYGAGHVPQDVRRAFDLMLHAVQENEDRKKMILFAKWLMYEEDDAVRNAPQARRLLERCLELSETRTERKQVKLLLRICEGIIEREEAMSSSNSDLTDDDPDTPPEAILDYDVFISHAGTEKQSVAIPLMKGLEAHGLRCFLDQQELRGSTMTGSDQLFAAMRGSKAVIFILSLDFVARKWPMMELRQFLKLQEEALEMGKQPPLIIPLFHKLTVEECKDLQLPYRDGNMKLFRDYGFFDDDRQRSCPSTVAMAAVKKVASFVGLRNDEEDPGEGFANHCVQRIVSYFEKEFGSKNGVSEQ